jgi:hypothetical protein
LAGILSFAWRIRRGSSVASTSTAIGAGAADAATDDHAVRNTNAVTTREARWAERMPLFIPRECF